MNTSLKFLIDRTFAMPLAWAANLAARAAAPIARRNHRIEPEAVRTIVVAKLLGMGSIIQSTPLLHDLRKTFPNARITFVTTAANRGLVERLAVIDDAVYVDDANPSALLTSTARACAALLARKIDLYFDLEVYSAGASIVSIVSGARNRIGFYRVSAQVRRALHAPGRLQPPRAGLVDLPPAPPRCGWRAAGGPALGCAGRAAGRRRRPRHRARRNRHDAWETLRRREPERLRPLDRATVAGPPAGGAHRGTDGARRDGRPHGREERGADGGGSNALARRRRGRSTSGILSLGGLFALLKGAACVVTNDTGPMHFSIALDRPTVCLFGPVIPDHQCRRKANVEVLYHPVYCSPCARAGAALPRQQRVHEAHHRAGSAVGGRAPARGGLVPSTRLPTIAPAYTGLTSEPLGVLVRNTTIPATSMRRLDLLWCGTRDTMTWRPRWHQGSAWTMRRT